MRILRDPSACPDIYKGATVALGNFDGVHLGHQAILRHCVATAKASGAPAAVMTFEPHPREFFSKNGEKLRLHSFRDKVELLESMGIEALFAVRFNRRLASLSAQAFVEELLHKTLSVRHVVTGTNFAFGHNRQGNTEFLDKTAALLGMGYTACPPVFDAEGKPISSSAIRTALAAGDVKKAAALLGRPYRISGHVQRGDGRGRTLGFPTANLSLGHLFKPRFGIYAVRIAIENDGWNNGVASLGVKPMFGAHDPLLEAHLFDRNDELYGRRIRVELASFIRDEQRFDDVEALKQQMAEDSRRAREELNAGRR
jgi:riboflavin kinase/FMN adenylyltransferase